MGTAHDWQADALNTARHELAEADAYQDSVAGEEDPGAATEDIAEDIARQQAEIGPAGGGEAGEQPPNS